MRKVTFNGWLRELRSNGDDLYDEFLTEAVRTKNYPWREEYEEQFYFLFKSGADIERLGLFRDAYFDYLMEC
jgi:hypothetical protein